MFLDILWNVDCKYLLYFWMFLPPIYKIQGLKGLFETFPKLTNIKVDINFFTNKKVQRYKEILRVLNWLRGLTQGC